MVSIVPLLVLATAAGVSLGVPRSGLAAPAGPRAALGARLPVLPLRFEENRGQLDGRVRDVARQGAATIFLTDEEAVLRLPGAASAQRDSVLRMKLAGARAVRPRADRALPTRSNYFIGRDPSRWRTASARPSSRSVAALHPRTGAWW